MLPEMRSFLVKNVTEILQDKLVEFMKGVFVAGDRMLNELKEKDPDGYLKYLEQCPELKEELPPDEDFMDLAQESSYEDEVFGWKYSVKDEGFCVTGTLTLEDKTKDVPIVLSSWAELGKNQGFKISDRVIN